MVVLIVWLASKLRKAGIFSRVDDSNTSIGKRYARNDELGTPFGVTLDFACEYGPDDESAMSDVCHWRTAVQNRTMTLRYVYSSALASESLLAHLLRERDTTGQLIGDIDDVISVLIDLVNGNADWAAACTRLPAYDGIQAIID
jgi:glycyl-tRNA synthetase